MKTVLIACATEESIDSTRETGYYALAELWPGKDISKIDLWFVNIEDLNLSKGKRCLANLFTSDNIKETVKKCYKKEDLVFDAILLEHCPNFINTSKSFDNFFQILKPNGTLIIDRSHDSIPRAKETIKQVIRYNCRDTSAAEIYRDLKRLIPDDDDLEDELAAIFFERNEECRQDKKRSPPRSVVDKKSDRIKYSRNMLLSFILDRVVNVDLADPPHITYFDRGFIYDIDHFNSKLSSLGLFSREKGEFIFINRI